MRNSGIFPAGHAWLLAISTFTRQETPDPISISPCARVEFKFVRVWSEPRNLGTSEPRRQQFLLLRLGDIEWESGPNRAGALVMPIFWRWSKNRDEDDAGADEEWLDDG